MKIVYGRTIKWNPKTNRLLVRFPSLPTPVEISEKEISIYSLQKRNAQGVPYNIQDFFKKPVSYVETSPGHFSHSEIMLEQYKELLVGDKIEATITSISKWSLFLKYRDLSIRCCITEISNAFIKNLSDRFSVGEKITVKIISKNDSTHFIEASYKQCLLDSVDNYEIGDIVGGKIAGKVSTGDGYFVEVSPLVIGIMDTQFDFNYDDYVVCKINGKKKEGLKLQFCFLC